MSTPANPVDPKRGRSAAIAIVIAFLAIVGLLLYGVLVSDRADREALPSPLIGKPAPEFSLPVLPSPGGWCRRRNCRQPYLLNVWARVPGLRVEHPLSPLAEPSLRVSAKLEGRSLRAMRWLEQFATPTGCCGLRHLRPRWGI